MPISLFKLICMGIPGLVLLIMLLVIHFVNGSDGYSIQSEINNIRVFLTDEIARRNMALEEFMKNDTLGFHYVFMIIDGMFHFGIWILIFYFLIVNPLF